MNRSFLFLSSAVAAFSLSSCANNKATADDPYAAAPGVDAANPYGVPQAPAAPQAPSYPQANAPAVPSAPAYQPIPAPPAAPPAYGPASAYNPPPASIPSAPSFSQNTSPHTVVEGDTLWGLSRRYNTSVDAIKAANGLSGNTIVKGVTLNIPQ